MKFKHILENLKNIDEIRSNPDKNVDLPIYKQILNFVEKHANHQDLIFLSFRDQKDVTLINPINVYNTPTGLYTYPWKDYFKIKFEESLRNKLISRTDNIVPYAGNRKYLFLFKLKSSEGVLSNETTHNQLIPYANRLVDAYPKSMTLKGYVNEYINDYERFVRTKPYLFDDKREKSDVLIFWSLLNWFSNNINAEKINPNTQGLLKTDDFSYAEPRYLFSQICRKIGINGFLDMGTGYIHPNERYQCVFFRSRGLFEDIEIVNLFKQDRLTSPHNITDEVIEKLTLNDFGILMARAGKFSNQIVSKLVKSDIFVSSMDVAHVDIILKYLQFDERPDFLKELASKKSFQDNFNSIRMLDRIISSLGDDNYGLNILRSINYPSDIIDELESKFNANYKQKELNEEISKIKKTMGLNEYISKDEIYLRDYLSMSKEAKMEYLPHEYYYFFEDFLIETGHEFETPKEKKLSNYQDEPEEEVDMFDNEIELMIWLENNDRETYYKFAEYLYEKIKNNELPIDDSEYPAWSYFDDSPTLVKNQWLIHFTDEADSIALNGFKYGVDDMTKLGLTTHLGDFDKKYGGYNFAYTLHDFPRYAQSDGYHDTKYKYGKEAVVFNASGIKVWHYGDQEPQVIFYGNTAKNIIPITRGDETQWGIRDKNGNVLYENDKLEKVVEWLTNNYQQYRKRLR
jgi:hypothetical protein